jgi:hypothetical protein
VSENNPSYPQPSHGTGILKYVGVQGTMAQITTRHLDLYGAINPRLDFWYYHDATANELDMSYTDVNVIVDGVRKTVMSIYRKGAKTDWVEYSVDLTPYTTAQCALIEFVATNKFGPQSAQYIDRIFITSEKDLEVSEIIISPEINACGLKNRALSVVLTTKTNEAIYLSQYTDSLAVEFPGYPRFVVPLKQTITGKTSDTVLVTSNINIPMGSVSIKAYLTSHIDGDSTNDSKTLTLNTNPKTSIDVISATGNKDCFRIGESVQQDIILINNGNMDLSGIELSLRVIAGDNYTKVIKDSGTINLPVGDTLRHTFNNTYIVPDEQSYQVVVTAYLGCDSLLIDTSDMVNECADINNLLIAELINPGSQIEVAGSTEHIVVSITNESDNKRYENVTITTMIENDKGEMISSRVDIIPSIEFSRTENFTFTESYTVPNDSVYFIRIYLSSVDNYPEDDTLKRKRHPETTGIEALGKTTDFSLGQNIPNPANGNTLINYSVPESGQVIFHVHSISGQVLYSKTIEAPSGNQSIEFNTAMLSAGIYFYSMEYKGQRIVKRMSVR